MLKEEMITIIIGIFILIYFLLLVVVDHELLDGLYLITLFTYLLRFLIFKRNKDTL